MSDRVLVSFRMDTAQLEDVDRLVGVLKATGEGADRSSVIRAAVDAYLAQHETETDEDGLLRWSVSATDRLIAAEPWPSEQVTP